MPTQTAYQAYLPDQDGRVDYPAHDHETWQILYERQWPLISRLAHPVVLEGMNRLKLGKQRIPQCIPLSGQLQQLTGWSVTPVPALIGFRRFYGMLADRRFPAASFIRRREELDYLQEPDIFHEIFGHAPLLANPVLADFSRRIGELGKHANDELHVWLARLHWFTIEFSLMMHQGNIRALGAGLLSSPGEIRYAICSSQPVIRPFDLVDCLRTPYRIDIQQPLYYLFDDLEQIESISDDNILDAIAIARDLGLHEPLYPLERGSDHREPC